MVAKRAFHGGASRLVIGSHASEPVRATWNSTRATPLPGSLAVAASVIVPETLGGQAVERGGGRRPVDHDRGRRRRCLVSDRVRRHRAHLVRAITGQGRRHDAVRSISVGSQRLPGAAGRRSQLEPHLRDSAPAVGGARRKRQRARDQGRRCRRVERDERRTVVDPDRARCDLGAVPGSIHGRGRQGVRPVGKARGVERGRTVGGRDDRPGSEGQREVVDARQVVATDDLQRYGAAEPAVARRAVPVDRRGARVVVHDRPHDLRPRGAEERRADRVRARRVGAPGGCHGPPERPGARRDVVGPVRLVRVVTPRPLVVGDVEQQRRRSIGQPVPGLRADDGGVDQAAVRVRGRGDHQRQEDAGGRRACCVVGTTCGALSFGSWLLAESCCAAGPEARWWSGRWRPCRDRTGDLARRAAMWAPRVLPPGCARAGVSGAGAVESTRARRRMPRAGWHPRRASPWRTRARTARSQAARARRSRCLRRPRRRPVRGCRARIPAGEAAPRAMRGHRRSGCERWRSGGGGRGRVPGSGSSVASPEPAKPAPDAFAVNARRSELGSSPTRRRSARETSRRCTSADTAS